MAKGNSGRIVIEIEPELKQELYRALGSDGLSLKQWFLANADHYLNERTNPSLPLFTDADHQGVHR